MKSLDKVGWLMDPRAIITVIALLSLISGTWLLLQIPDAPAKITRVEVYNNTYLSAKEIQEFARVQDGDNFSPGVAERVEQRLMKVPSITEVDVNPGSSGVLEIHVREKSCAAILRNGPWMLDIAYDLEVLSVQSVRCTGVPVIAGHYPVEEGEVRSEPLQSLVGSLQTFQRNYPQLYSQFSEIRMEGGGNITIFLQSRRIRIRMHGFFTEKNAKRLYTALSYFEKKGSAGVIDLRGPDAILLPEL